MSQANFDVLDKVRKQLKHARIQRDRVPRGAPEAVLAKAHAKVAELEQKRDELYNRPASSGATGYHAACYIPHGQEGDSASAVPAPVQQPSSAPEASEGSAACLVEGDRVEELTRYDGDDNKVPGHWIYGKVMKVYASGMISVAYDGRDGWDYVPAEKVEKQRILDLA